METLNGNFIIPIFTRFLKEENLYHIWRYAMSNFPSKEYTVFKWSRLINADSKFAMFLQHRKLVTYAPFVWDSQTHPRDIRGTLPNEINSWNELSIKWKNFLIDSKEKFYGIK